ncbi:type II secretion system protein GspL [Halioxenophilus sp. WMMB6]|uniref:type II secretion system protein GspL n=1 Tax=Halioxenophilus sp. WMMB6 TaxID=3073815 RepID=UPI00295E56F0|nr:type II secretion system protein GspL [Halioxenophilus sp. WMMB6]
MNRLVVIYDAQLPEQDPATPQLAWRLLEDGSWMGPAEQGTITELAAAQTDSHAEIWLALASQEIVLVEGHFSAKERRHLAKLMPYELEDDILGDVDEFHFAYGTIHGDRVAVAYTPLAWLETLLAQFEGADLEVAVCLPLPLLLPFTEQQWSLRWLGGDAPVEVRYRHDLAYSVPLDLLQESLLALLSEQPEGQAPEQVKLFGQNFEDLQTLQDTLPESLQEKATSAQWDQWLSLAVELLPALNLRQQSLGRSLPIARWWQTWRPAAIAAGIALVLFLGSNWAALASLKGQQQRHLAAAESAYRSVVPQGAMVDPEKQLKTQLSRYKSDAGEGDNGVVPLLAKISPTLASNSDIKVLNLHYVEGDMRLNVESSDFRQIDQLRASLENQHLLAELQGTSSVAAGVQARLRIRSIP